MEEQIDGSGRFTNVVLRPTVTVAAGADTERANALHHTAHTKWFIANSVSFNVACEPTVIVAN
jgi:organic hydroperoxide reductase OsmC/OhrA